MKIVVDKLGNDISNKKRKEIVRWAKNRLYELEKFWNNDIKLSRMTKQEFTNLFKPVWSETNPKEELSDIKLDYK